MPFRVAPGEELSYCIRLNPRVFQAYDVEKKAWVDVPGNYQILAGSSSEDIRQTVKILIYP